MEVLNKRLAVEMPRTHKSGASHYDEVFQRVLTTLSEQITPGERVPADKQLAQQLGVSNVTIGRVMHELQRVGVVQRVPGKGTYLRSDSAAIIEQNGFALTESIEGSEASVTGKVGVEAVNQALPSAEGTFTWIITSFHPGDVGTGEAHWAMRTASSIERAVQRAGGRTLITNTDPYAKGSSPHEVLEKLASERVGVIIVPSGRILKDCPEIVWRLLNVDGSAPDWPIVHLSFGLVDLPFDTVRIDDERGIYASVAHLWSLGHRELAYVLPDKEWGLQFPWLQLRINAFERAVNSISGGTAQPHLVYGSIENLSEGVQWRDSARTAGLALLQLPEYAAITGLVATNDTMAGELMSLFREHGRRVPEEYSITGFDDNLWSSSLGLTTLHVPIEEMGEQAAQLVLRRLARPEANQRFELVLRPTLVVRETTAPLMQG